MGAEECNLLAFTNDFDTLGTSALEMVSSELDFDTNIAISNHCSSSVEITWVSVFTTIICSKRTHSFDQVVFLFCFFLVLCLTAMASAVTLHWVGLSLPPAGQGSLQKICSRDVTRKSVPVSQLTCN